MVIILGEAMQLPASSQLTKPTEATALAALVLAFLGISDLVAAALPHLTAFEYWVSQVPVRLTLLFGVTGYVYLFKDDGLLGSSGASLLKRNAGPGQYVKNDLVFATGFLEVCVWFWVFVLLKEERRSLAEKIAEKRKLDDDLAT